MTRNACINHPDKDLVEILPGSKQCKRCGHIIPPELEIVEIVQDMVLEAKAAGLIKTPVEAETEAPVEVPSIDTNPEAELPEESEAIVEGFKEAVEAEPEPEVVVEEEPEKVELEAEPETHGEEAMRLVLEAKAAKEEKARKAKIKALKAQLAELEPEDE